MSSRTLELSDSIYSYLLENIRSETEAARELREETRSTLSMHGMQISPEQGAFMALLCRLISASRTIEVGTFTGYSTLSVAQALPDDGVVIACDVSEEWTNIAKRYWQQAGVAHKISLRIGPAKETLTGLLNNLEQETFDFAFIDADKANYGIYYEQCLELLRVGGLLAVDNVLWGGRTADPSIKDASTTAIRELNAKIADDQRVFATMLPIGDGLTLIQKL